MINTAIASGIYIIQNTTNRKTYVGSAVNILRRWYDHRSNLRRNEHENPHLQRAWIKYGEASFQFSVIEEIADTSLLVSAEQDWIDTCSPEYNICRVAGSHLGTKHSAEAKAKMSAAKLGGKQSPEHRKNHSIATKKAWARRKENAAKGVTQ